MYKIYECKKSACTLNQNMYRAWKENYKNLKNVKNQNYDLKTCCSEINSCPRINTIPFGGRDTRK